MRLGWVLVGVVGVTGCGSDLPQGWETAERARVVQSACIETTDDLAEYFEADLDVPESHLDYLGAPFPCDQELRAFWRLQSSALEVLVQPVELDPSQHPRCSCRYDLSIDVTVIIDPTSAAVYRRQNETDDVIRVGTAIGQTTGR